MTQEHVAERIALFEGRSLRVFQEADFIGFRAAKGHRLTSPKSAGTLFLRDESIDAIAVVALQSTDWVTLHMQGDFREGGLPSDIELSPVRADEAAEIVALLNKRLRLPRVEPTPEPIYPYQLTSTGPSQLATGTCIRVVGRYRRGHFEGPNFEGAKLQGDPALLQGLIDGQRYAVTGTYDPGLLSPLAKGQARPVGWSGPAIYVRNIQPEPAGPRRASLAGYTPPPSPFRRGPVWAWLHEAEYRGPEQLEFSTRLDSETRIVAALDGQGGDRTGNWAATVGLLTLATLIPEPYYQPSLGAPIEPPPEPRDDFAAWVGWLVDRSPLPGEPAALLNALGLRMGHVLQELNLRGYSLGLSGVLALIRHHRVTLLRRGLARAYLLRQGQLQVLLYEDTLGRRPEIVADPAALADLGPAGSTPVSLFVPRDFLPSAPPLEIDVQPGDRLIFALGGELLEALADPARERLLAAAEPIVIAGLPATRDMETGGWGVVAVDID
ncbi:MAG TPA: hypothetical protein PKI03_10875 [Pseudomonadota bacterium]|nr:hypothetical protein [Pseudomonadota bacterium]